MLAMCDTFVDTLKTKCSNLVTFPGENERVDWLSTGILSLLCSVEAPAVFATRCREKSRRKAKTPSCDAPHIGSVG